jgi:4-alpha-glucanotransferase
VTTSADQKRPQRSAGILLHPTSLPGPYGIGDLGPAAIAWVDALVRARQTWWQVLPLGPTGFGDSPYQSFSAFAGNPYLISPELLVRDGLLEHRDLQGADFPTDHVAYGPVIQFKVAMLRKAWDKFKAGLAPTLRQPFETFSAQQARWLEDYALYMALKDAHGGSGWLNWPKELLRRDPPALAEARKRLAHPIGYHKFSQFLFFRQWQSVLSYAHQKGINLMGDCPIFVSADSADVWANPELFRLDEERKPLVVAGVPPDYFSATGQLWGNPLYDWDKLRQTGYAWWIARIRATLEQVDLIRLDHFRGFEAYWEVPADRPTAEIGRWVQAPGADLLEKLRAALGGKLPLIAEDLGLITYEVEALRERFNLPGMRILQFAFGGAAEHRFLPHNYDRNTVVYTGTHDNDTTVGWFKTLNDHERHYLRRYAPHAESDAAWGLLRMAWASVADYALTPLQDVLNLGTEARMNMPGRATGNWGWRFTREMLRDDILDRLADLTDVYWRR